MPPLPFLKLIGLIGFLGLLPTTSAAASRADRLPALYSNACDLEQPLRVDHDAAEHVLSVPAGRCMVISDGTNAGFVTIYRSRRGKMPSLAFLPAEPRILVVQIIGGPGGYPFAPLLSRKLWDEHVRLAKGGTAWITPAYLGTSTRSTYPRSDYPYAVEEITEYVRFLKSTFPLAKLMIVGQSMGAILASDVSSRVRVDHLILVSPLFWSPRKAFGYFEKQSPRDFSAVHLNIVDPNSARLLKIASPIRSDLLFENYLGSVFDMSLREQLRSPRARCIDIVYGKMDQRIGQMYAPSAGKWKIQEQSGRTARVTIFKNADHDITQTTISLGAIATESLSRGC